MLAATLVFVFVVKHRPVRMDYSLFLRAARGLPSVSTWRQCATAAPLGPSNAAGVCTLLGSRWLAVNFRWEMRGLALRLPPVKSMFVTNMAGAFIAAQPLVFPDFAWL